jgi:hypothetical protein
MAYQVRGRVGRGARRTSLRGLEPNRRYRRVTEDSDAEAIQSTGAALMGAGLPIFAEQPPDPLHVSDWLSEVQLWEATEG